MPFYRNPISSDPQAVPPLTTDSMDFRAYWKANEANLIDRPGRGLILRCPESPHFREVNFMVGGEVCSAPLHEDGMIDVDEIGCLDPRGWDFEGEEWVVRQLNKPEFIDIRLRPYGEVSDLYFEHEDFEIRDPTLSECGRFTVDPRHYGFVKISPDFTLWYRPVPQGSLVVTPTQVVLMDESGQILAARDIDAIPVTGEEEAPV
ncbi:hypothetical protein [Pseudomonas aeruginosa]|uniref:hypothetical protein n=1 Tax=Pseudomonas aeruginosa TaxID=287 RepID=UPI001F1AF4B9|nr:hypothetical protein [Pseudomonas aeruginosa]